MKSKLKIRDLTSTMENKKFHQIFDRYKVLKKIINNKPRIFDIGAYQGQSIVEFTKNFKNCNIHSFEPNTKLKKDLNYIKKKYEKKHQIYLNFVAMGDKQKNINFYLNSESSQSSPIKINFKSKLFIKMKKLNKKRNFLNKNNVKIKVKQITVDKYCKNKKIKKIDILKSDTQGYDLNVLKGSKKMMPNISAIIVELNFYDFYEKSNNFYELEQLIKKNFVFWDISMIYKNPKWGSTDWADVIYINKKLYKNIL